ncbi:hypothetical protein ACFXAM_20305, partial [Kitasatospora sp. NPDC059462]
MSGYRHASPYPSYEPVYEAPQQPYGGHQEYDVPLYEGPHEDHGFQDHGHQGHPDHAHQGHGFHGHGFQDPAEHDVYDRPFQEHRAEPEFRPEPP